VERDERQVEIWKVPSLRFTDTYAGPVRGSGCGAVDGAKAGRPGTVAARGQRANWMWVVAGDWMGWRAVIRTSDTCVGRCENHALATDANTGNLTHCAHHHRWPWWRCCGSKSSLHALSRLCHFARQTLPVGKPRSTSCASSFYRSLALWARRSGSSAVRHSR